jgi:hypothetical protein
MAYKIVPLGSAVRKPINLVNFKYGVTQRHHAQPPVMSREQRLQEKGERARALIDAKRWNIWTR